MLFLYLYGKMLSELLITKEKPVYQDTVCDLLITKETAYQDIWDLLINKETLN